MTDQNTLNIIIRARNEAQATLAATSAQLKSIATDYERFAYLRGPDAAARQITNLTKEVNFLKSSLASMDSIVGKGLEAPAKAAAAALEAVGTGSKNAAAASTVLQREMRHIVALFDELASGRRGQFISSVGASLRDAGLGAGTLGTAMAAFAGVAAVATIIHLAKSTAELNENMTAAAATAGMSAHNFAILQGALILSGAKADSADQAFRRFAAFLEKGMANSGSEAAKAFHAIGIQQDELTKKGQDVFGMLLRTSEALNKWADSSTKAAFLELAFGRSDAAVARFMSRLDELIPQTRRWSDAVDENRQKFLGIGEELNKLSLDWATLKEKAATPLDFVVRLTITGLDHLKEAGDVLGNIMRYGTVGGPMVSASQALMNLWKKNTNYVGGPYPDNEFLDLIPPIRTGPASDPRPTIPPFSTPKGSSRPDKDITSDIAALRTSIQGLQHDYQLAAEQQDQMFIKARLQARLALSDKEISPISAAKQDYDAYRQANEQKIVELHKLQSDTDAVYSQIIAKAQQVYAQDPRYYKEAVQQKINADKEFAVQEQKINNETLAHFIEVINAHKRMVQTVVHEWGAAFDRIGDAFVSAFDSLLTGQQKLGDIMKRLFSSIFSDVTKSVGGGLLKMLMNNVPGMAGAGSFGEGIAKSIGIGSAGGLFGTGIGAVADVAKDTAKAAEITGPITLGLTALGVDLTAAMEANTAAIVSAVIAAGANPEVAGFKLASGGIIPSAAGGMTVGDGLGGRIAIVHPREMVLPANISTGLQRMIAQGGQQSLNFAYNANVTGYNPFQSRADMEGLLRRHGNLLMNFVGNAARNGWAT